VEQMPLQRVGHLGSSPSFLLKKIFEADIEEKLIPLHRRAMILEISPMHGVTV
jgi:hypothetical protein